MYARSYHCSLISTRSLYSIYLTSLIELSSLNFIKIKKIMGSLAQHLDLYTTSQTELNTCVTTNMGHPCHMVGSALYILIYTKKKGKNFIFFFQLVYKCLQTITIKDTFLQHGSV